MLVFSEGGHSCCVSGWVYMLRVEYTGGGAGSGFVLHQFTTTPQPPTTSQPLYH